MGGGLGQNRTGDQTIFSHSLVPIELPSQTRFQCHSPKKAYDTKTFATWTGFEPATSAVTGRRANQLRYRFLWRLEVEFISLTSYWLTR